MVLSPFYVVGNFYHIKCVMVHSYLLPVTVTNFWLHHQMSCDRMHTNCRKLHIEC